MRYPTTLDSIVRTAALTATNVVASSAFDLLERDAAGAGTVGLSGSYTGADDAVIDIEITSTTINGAPQISAPAFSGVGNGRISGISASSGIAAQEFTVTVLDLGTPTRKAWAPFQSVNLQAKTAGTAGNALSLQVSQSGLTATATDYSVTRELSAEGEDFVGDEFHFGATDLEPEGTVPASAPRIRFGDDVTVYRHWRQFVGGRYHYHFSPAIRRTVPVGTRVYAITNGRTVTVLDGATVVETYPDITTLYSLLSAITSTSALLEVDGVVAQDRRPGGMACDDLSVYTASYSAGSTRDGTPYIRRAVIPLTLSSTAPTENLRVECIAAPIPGAEIWSVVGSVSGTLANAISGVLYSASGYGFTVPQELQPGTEPEGDRSAHLELLTRGAAERIPSLCVRNFRLGVEAQTRTYTFEWRPHPGEECDCRSEPVIGGPNDEFLGITGGGSIMGTVAPEILSRVVTVDTWRRDGMDSNAQFAAATGVFLQEVAAVSGTDSLDLPYGYTSGFTANASANFTYDDADMRAFDAVADAYITALKDVQSKLNEWPSGVATAFDDAFSSIQSAMSPLSGVVGSTGWNSLVNSAYTAIQTATGSTDFSVAYDQAVELATQLATSKNVATDLAPLMRLVRGKIRLIYAAAALDSPFDVASPTGNSVWQDFGGTHWFVSQDGYLPIQPGHYYHSARMETDPDTEEETPVATGEYGIGVAIGCPENLKVGDKLIVKTSPYGNGRATYQAGDFIEYQITRADPVALGGGQIGDDTITFGVVGSVVGALDPYALVTTAPTGYSNGGLAFSIAPGAIAFAPGDRWTFSAEGGEFRWRFDDGSWTTTDIAATVSLMAGVSAAFAVGETPSFVTGDTYQLAALATNGAGQVRAPDGEALTWTTSLQLDITPSGSGEVDTLMIGGHTIPSTATITLSGSNDNWSSVAYSAAITWRDTNIGFLLPVATTCTKWRLEVDAGGSIDWLYLGVPSRLLLAGSTLTEHGTWQRRVRLSNGIRTRGIGGTVVHTGCSAESVDDLLTAIEYALENDDARIGAVSPSGEAGICTVPDDIQVDDIFGHQPDESLRRLSLQLQLTPV